MRKSLKVLIPGLMLALASGTVLAHDDDADFGLSLVVPAVAAAAALAAPPVYAAPRVYVAPPATYYAPPPRAYYYPAPSYYYSSPPGVSAYYGRSHEDFDRRRRWHRERDDRGDDD